MIDRDTMQELFNDESLWNLGDIERVTRAGPWDTNRWRNAALNYCQGGYPYWPPDSKMLRSIMLPHPEKPVRSYPPHPEVLPPPVQVDGAWVYWRAGDVWRWLFQTNQFEPWMLTRSGDATGG